MQWTRKFVYFCGIDFKIVTKFISVHIIKKHNSTEQIKKSNWLYSIIHELGTSHLAIILGHSRSPGISYSF